MAVVETISRRSFIRGSFRKATLALRPPWAIDEDYFTNLCTRCDDCVKSCPERIVVRGRAGFPEVDFHRGECTFCARCVEVCPTGALSGDPSTGTPPWSLLAYVDDRCLAQGGVVCRICGEQCEPGAVQFKLVTGGAPNPNFDAESCTGCGACLRTCPSGAIEMRGQP